MKERTESQSVTTSITHSGTLRWRLAFRVGPLYSQPLVQQLRVARCVHHILPRMTNWSDSPLLHPPLPPKDTKELGFSPGPLPLWPVFPCLGAQWTRASLFPKPCEPIVAHFLPQHSSTASHASKLSPKPIQKEEEKFVTLMIRNLW